MRKERGEATLTLHRLVEGLVDGRKPLRADEKGIGGVDGRDARRPGYRVLYVAHALSGRLGLSRIRYSTVVGKSLSHFFPSFLKNSIFMRCQRAG